MTVPPIEETVEAYFISANELKVRNIGEAEGTEEVYQAMLLRDVADAITAALARAKELG